MFKHDMRTIRGNKTLELFKEKAEVLFEENEYDEVTVAQICEACGVTKGAFYHHFSSKDELYNLLQANKYSESMMNGVTAMAELYPDDPRRQITGWLMNTWRLDVENGKERSREQMRIAGKVFPMGEYVGHVAAQIKALSAWQQQGLLRQDLTPQQLWEYINAFSYGYCNLWCIDRAEFPSEELVYDFVGTLFCR